jgi:hypothetical protein
MRRGRYRRFQAIRLVALLAFGLLEFPDPLVTPSTGLGRDDPGEVRNSDRVECNRVLDRSLGSAMSCAPDGPHLTRPVARASARSSPPLSERSGRHAVP